MTMTRRGWFRGPGHWWLAPEGAAIHRMTRTAVVADVHLGYEWARGSRGDCVPAHSLDETVTQLASLLNCGEIHRLVVAGDLVESRRFCRRTDADVVRLTRWLLDRGVELVALAGNHDPPRGPARLKSLVIDGWTIAHGDKPLAGSRTITGHLHPRLRAGGVSAPCFLVGPGRIVLPAFSGNAAGVHVAGLGQELTRGGEPPLRCIASTGDELLDFGPIPDLLQSLR
jgi:metallophosphoesterase superfamily enzyme